MFQIVTASYTDLQDYTYYFVPAPWLSVKLLRLLQNYTPPGEFNAKLPVSSCLQVIYSIRIILSFSTMTASPSLSILLTKKNWEGGDKALIEEIHS